MIQDEISKGINMRAARISSLFGRDQIDPADVVNDNVEIVMKSLESGDIESIEKAMVTIGSHDKDMFNDLLDTIEKAVQKGYKKGVGEGWYRKTITDSRGRTKEIWAKTAKPKGGEKSAAGKEQDSHTDKSQDKSGDKKSKSDVIDQKVIDHINKRSVAAEKKSVSGESKDHEADYGKLKAKHQKEYNDMLESGDISKDAVSMIDRHAKERSEHPGHPKNIKKKEAKAGGIQIGKETGSRSKMEKIRDVFSEEAARRADAKMPEGSLHHKALFEGKTDKHVEKIREDQKKYWEEFGKEYDAQFPAKSGKYTFSKNETGIKPPSISDFKGSAFDVKHDDGSEHIYFDGEYGGSARKIYIRMFEKKSPDNTGEHEAKDEDKGAGSDKKGKAEKPSDQAADNAKKEDTKTRYSAEDKEFIMAVGDMEYYESMKKDQEDDEGDSTYTPKDHFMGYIDMLADDDSRALRKLHGKLLKKNPKLAKLISGEYPDRFEMPDEF